MLLQGRLGSSGDTVDVSTVQNIMGLIFVLTVFLGMFNAMTASAALLPRWPLHASCNWVQHLESFRLLLRLLAGPSVHRCGHPPSLSLLCHLLCRAPHAKRLLCRSLPPQVQPVVAAERLVFYRERSSSYYAALPYAAASGVVEVPYLIVQATLMVVISYWWAACTARRHTCATLPARPSAQGLPPLAQRFASAHATSWATSRCLHPLGRTPAAFPGLRGCHAGWLASNAWPGSSSTSCSPTWPPCPWCGAGPHVRVHG